MIYELATLSGPVLKVGALRQGATRWLDEAKTGSLLGSWRMDVGEIGTLILLRGFEDEGALQEERMRALMSADPFSCGDLLESLKMESYRGFPFLAPVVPRTMGGIYEIRTYFLKNGGLAPTLRAWEDVMAPAKEYTDHLIINMFALDGPPRITHIWGFESFEERVRLRDEHYKAGLWPPKGGPEQIATATSSIMLSNADSPLN